MKKQIQKGRLDLVNTCIHLFLQKLHWKGCFIELILFPLKQKSYIEDAFLYIVNTQGKKKSFSSPVTISQQIVLSKMPFETVMSMTTVKIGK